jgi:protein-tyrosine kinase
MSRIHEALKKAERERTTQGNHNHVTAPEVAPAVEDMPEKQETDFCGERKPEIPSATAGDAERATKNGSNLQRREFLRFDDLRRRSSRPEWHPDPNANVFFNPELSEHGAEQFRTLRSRLYQFRTERPLRTLLVTSSIPGEGKTFVASNLAQSIVRQPDRRALIIDADLRCPRLHSVFGAPCAPGLTDYLRAEADEFEIVQRGPEENLCFVPGGTEVTNPSELLSAGRMQMLIERLAPVFDWVILDSPPCLPVADAISLAGLCDGVLLVVRAGVTASETAQKAYQELRDKNVVGVVLNAVRRTHLYGSGYQDTYGYSRHLNKAV